MIHSLKVVAHKRNRYGYFFSEFVKHIHVAVSDQKYGRQSTGLSLFCAMTVPMGYNDCCETVVCSEQMSYYFVSQ